MENRREKGGKAEKELERENKAPEKLKNRREK